jgi:hypothetical protein
MRADSGLLELYPKEMMFLVRLVLMKAGRQLRDNWRAESERRIRYEPFGNLLGLLVAHCSLLNRLSQGQRDRREVASAHHAS